MDHTHRHQEETITGMIERILYHDPESGYTVFKVRPDNQSKAATIVGHTPVGDAGEQLVATGRWIDSRQYGLQFKASRIQVQSPKSMEGIERYLSSGAIVGIGHTYAKRLLQHFGLSVLDIIEQSPERLTEVAGIGRLKAKKIKSSWDAQQGIRDIMIFLHTYGVSSAKASKIYAHYGHEAINLISENPYQLAIDIQGIGFMAADQLAKQLDIGQHSPLRVRAALWHVLSRANQDGHCGLPIEELIHQTMQLTNLTQDFIEKNIQAGIKEGRLIADSIAGAHFVFPAWVYRSEQQIARKLRQLSFGSLPWKITPIESRIDDFEKASSLTLSISQRAALTQVLSNKLLIMTGGPGVGKTTLVRAILGILANEKLNIALCAPTGRAAKRLTESAGQSAKTIHRLLGAQKGSYQFQYNDLQPLKIDVLIVDESSMIDISLMLSLLKAVPEKAAVFFVGDVDQLPSIGPGRVFADMIDSERMPTVRLTEIFRQASSSDIVKISHQIQRGQWPTFPVNKENADCFFIESDLPENTLSKLLSVVTNRIPKAFGVNAVTDIQVIVPMNRGSLGTKAINYALQTMVNQHGQMGIERGELRYFVGDKVMQLENDYDKDIFNGDIGFIHQIHSEEQKLVVNFDGKMVDYPFTSLDSISLAYAITVHKSQGSEYPVVVFVLSKQHFPMLQRNLVYTAISRGKQRVVIIGQKQALKLAIEKDSLPARFSRLMLFLKAAF